MLHNHIFSDPRLPTLRIVKDDKDPKVLRIEEVPGIEQKIDVPKVSDCDSYIQGLFDGILYRGGEFRQMQLDKLAKSSVDAKPDQA